MANHKRHRPKTSRAGCLMCKPQKLNAHKTAERRAAQRGWESLEEAAEVDGVRVRSTHYGV